MRRGAWLTLYNVPDNFWTNETEKELDKEEGKEEDKRQEIEESAINKDSDTFCKNSKAENSDNDET